MVASDKDGTIGNNRIRLTTRWASRLTVIRIIWIKSVWMLLVIYSEFTIFYSYTFAWISDYSFYDILFTLTFGIAGVFKDDDLPTWRDVAFVLQLRPRYGEAINDETITCKERRLHTRPFDVEAAKYECIDKDRTDNHTDNKHNKATDVFDLWVSS